MISKYTTFFTILIAASYSTACATESETTTDGYASAHTTTINPEIPENVKFAGNDISLDRIDMYERFDRELTAIVYTHGTTLLTIKRANRYFPVMAPILRKYGIPEDMLYLACIESNLNWRAYSSAKAAGLWQFIPSTAKSYGLEVNEYVDERYDPVKSTEAACRYLKKAYAKYGNWESVAASYNGGMGRITKELDDQQQQSAYDLYLVDETSRYMFRLLAMKQVMDMPANYGFSIRKNQLYNPIRYSEVTVDGPVESWPDWAVQHGISYAQLRESNPWIRSKSLPNKTSKTYTVRIPENKDLQRSTAQYPVYNANWVAD